MYDVLIIHEVDDYAAWKIGFDDASGLRKSAGEIAFKLLKYADDPNRIVHFSEWQSLDCAKEFFESEAVRDIRKNLGVKDPQFIYLDALEEGIL
jgi:heme-degrading monooxygenase HmoA